MRAIRPIYDGKDDLDQLDHIDHIDMMICLFSEINERVEAMEDIPDDKQQLIRQEVNKEILPAGVICTEDGINDDLYVPDAEDEFTSSRGTVFDELIVMFEITRWLNENCYGWSAAVSAKFKYIAIALGIISGKDPKETGSYGTDVYVLNVEGKAFQDLKRLLPLHWATIMLDWYLVVVNGIGNVEMIQFGNLSIVRQDNMINSKELRT